MVKRIELVFDGKTFVPSEAVGLPSGTRVVVVVTVNEDASPVSPRPWTEADEQRWHELQKGWTGAAAPWPTVEDALGYSRARPGYHLIPDGEASPATDEGGS